MITLALAENAGHFTWPDAFVTVGGFAAFVAFMWLLLR